MYNDSTENREQYLRETRTDFVDIRAHIQQLYTYLTTFESRLTRLRSRRARVRWDPFGRTRANLDGQIAETEEAIRKTRLAISEYEVQSRMAYDSSRATERIETRQIAHGEAHRVVASERAIPPPGIDEPKGLFGRIRKMIVG